MSDHFQKCNNGVTRLLANAIVTNLFADGRLDPKMGLLKAFEVLLEEIGE